MNRIVSEREWIEARKQLLGKEKELTRQRDALAKRRQQLPWRRIEKEYQFEGTNGRNSLASLFGPHSQLIIYHFMFAPEWDDGCKSCSLCADHYDPLRVHFGARGVSLVTISLAPVEKIEAYKRRMGWSFAWLSSEKSDFNRDFGVTFTKDEQDEERMTYNYRRDRLPSLELPGISVFTKNERSEVFHTYSAYARGLEEFFGVYRFLDIVPKGRNEDELRYGMEWVHRHDEYGETTS